MRREREAPWSSPLFPYMGWIILGWFLTWAAVELDMLQRLLDTESLTGAQWAIVLGLSLIAPGARLGRQGHPALTPAEGRPRARRRCRGRDVQGRGLTAVARANIATTTISSRRRHPRAADCA